MKNIGTQGIEVDVDGRYVVITTRDGTIAVDGGDKDALRELRLALSRAATNARTPRVQGR